MPITTHSAIVGRLIPAFILIIERRIDASDGEVDFPKLRKMLEEASGYMDMFTAE